MVTGRASAADCAAERVGYRSPTRRGGKQSLTSTAYSLVVFVVFVVFVLVFIVSSSSCCLRRSSLLHLHLIRSDKIVNPVSQNSQTKDPSPYDAGSCVEP